MINKEKKMLKRNRTNILKRNRSGLLKRTTPRPLTRGLGLKNDK
jgi:hypothetical protein